MHGSSDMALMRRAEQGRVGMDNRGTNIRSRSSPSGGSGTRETSDLGHRSCFPTSVFVLFFFFFQRWQFCDGVTNL